jgi:hypothetical protein
MRYPAELLPHCEEGREMDEFMPSKQRVPDTAHRMGSYLRNFSLVLEKLLSSPTSQLPGESLVDNRVRRP